MAHVKLHERRLVAMEVRGFMQAPQRITMTILYQRKQREKKKKKKKIHGTCREQTMFAIDSSVLSNFIDIFLTIGLDS